jgi:hypothetical protein
VADDAIVEDGCQIPRSNRIVIVSDALAAKDLCGSFRQHRHCEECTGPSPPKPAAQDDKAKDLLRISEQ